MTSLPHDEDWNLEAEEQKHARQEADTARYVSRLNDEWLKTHGKRVKAIEADLLKDSPRSTAVETMLLRLIAHDVALAELLGRSELLIAQRTLAFVDNVKNCLALAKALKQVATCREVTTRRMQELMQAFGVVRGQRRLRESVPLRRVA